MRSTRWSGNEVASLFTQQRLSCPLLTTHLDSIAIGVIDRDFEIIATVSPGASRSRSGRVALDQEKTMIRIQPHSQIDPCRRGRSWLNMHRCLYTHTHKHTLSSTSLIPRPHPDFIPQPRFFSTAAR